jgi:hypothetical protein
MKEKYLEICVQANKPLFFHGYVVKEDDDFIHFFDEKEKGIVLLNKKKVVFIKEYKNVFLKLKEEIAKELGKNGTKRK